MTPPSLSLLPYLFVHGGILANCSSRLKPWMCRSYEIHTAYYLNCSLDSGTTECSRYKIYGSPDIFSATGSVSTSLQGSENLGARLD